MAVQKFQVSNTTAFKWADNTLFNGYALAILAFPSGNSGVFWDYGVLNDTPQRLRLPKVSKFPIREGFFVSDCYLWGNSGAANSIHPPGTTYSFLFYDNSDRLIAIHATTYALSANLNLVQSAFTNTTAATALGHGQSSFSGVPTVETPTGLVNGANLNFTLSRVPNQLILFKGTSTPLVGGGTDYTLSGANLTMVVAPTNPATFKAYIF